MPQFTDADAAYLNWLSANPHGFVLNAERHPNPRYLILHRAACKSISRSAEPPVRWTTGGYLKMCAATTSEIDDWCFAQTGGHPQPCGQCRPLSPM